MVEAIQESKPLVVFVFAYGDYALRAFEYEAFDYVEKPIDPGRFSQVLDRIDERLVEKKAVSLVASGSRISRRRGCHFCKHVPARQRTLNPKFSHKGWYIEWGKASADTDSPF